jgi:acyl-CoA dehydrogenase
MALVRSAQMVGALEAVLPMSVQYARDRRQFGQPIASFQAVRHLLARLAGEVLAAQAAFDLVYRETPEAIGAAKIRIGEAATKAAQIAHQVHGALGFTEEHSLALFTRRLWRWREDGGNEAWWAEWTGRRLVERGGDGVWPLLTSLPSSGPVA